MSRLQQELQNGNFVITAELSPPKSCSREVIEKKALLLKDRVTAVNITDNQTAVVRLSSIAAGAILVQMGIEPVIQAVCRDRNRIALQSDILGACALGIQNVLALTGDHQKFGNHPQAKNVFDLDSVQWVAALNQMREGKFINGEEIKNPPQLFIGAAANPFADHRELELLKLSKKIKAGADFIQTQPVFDVAAFSQWLEKVREKGWEKKVHILAGVMPVKSAKMLNYMRENVPGVKIPEAMIKQLEKAADFKAEAIEICAQTIQELRGMPGVRGVHIMAVEWESVVSEIIAKSGELIPKIG